MSDAGYVAPVRRTLTRTDRILPATRWISALIVPFLLAAFGVLYLLPARTGELFAWNVQPRMTAMMLGEAYLAGAYFFVRAVLSPRWHWVAVGFLPVTTFATLMGISTILPLGSLQSRQHRLLDLGVPLLHHPLSRPSRVVAQSARRTRRTYGRQRPGRCHSGCVGPWARAVRERFSSVSCSSCSPLT